MSFEKDVWVSVAFSWLLPGAGHICLEKRCQAGMFFAIYVFLYISLVCTATIESISALISLLNAIFLFLIYPVLVSIHAFLCRNKVNKDCNISNEKTMNPWLAVFLSLLVPGLGHLYTRKWLWMVVLLYFFLGSYYYTMSSFVWIFRLVLRIFACYHAYITAIPFQPKKKILLFCALALLIITVTNVLVPSVVRKYIVQIFPISGSSMEPMFFESDYIVVNKLIRKSNLLVGDVIIFENPAEPSIYSFKRIVAVTGQSVITQEDKIFIDSILYYPPKTFRSISDLPENRDNLNSEETLQVPAGSFFVIGDNIEQSFDSRHFGPVAKKHIVGKVVKVLWPLNRTFR